MKRYPVNIFSCPGIFSGLSLGCHGPWITLVHPMSKHLLFNQMQPTDQQKFSLNDEHEQTAQQVHQVQEDLLTLGAAAPLRSLVGGGGRGSPPRHPPQQPPPPPWRGMALAGDGRHHHRGHCHCAVHMEAAPPHNTGTVSPATPGDNKDVGSVARGTICERIGNQQNIRKSKFMRNIQAENNT